MQFLRFFTGASWEFSNQRKSSWLCNPADSATSLFFLFQFLFTSFFLLALLLSVSAYYSDSLHLFSAAFCLPFLACLAFLFFTRLLIWFTLIFLPFLVCLSIVMFTICLISRSTLHRFFCYLNFIYLSTAFLFLFWTCGLFWFT